MIIFDTTVLCNAAVNEFSPTEEYINQQRLKKPPAPQLLVFGSIPLLKILQLPRKPFTHSGLNDKRFNLSL
ncbi:MAG: hypothetical protein M3R17_21260 [Bacteroidota bacterium]|nr:hypothetical protein [Bacteroidota bacterium]